jgi:hypothetical protein
MPYAAKTLTYVRTPGGVVRVDVGGRLPRDVDKGHVAKLAAAGAVVEVKARKPKTDDAAGSDGTPEES